MRRVREWLSRGWEDLIVDTSTMPGQLRDELSIIQFDRLRQRIPILYVVLAMICVGAGLASQGDFPIALQIAMPALMLVASIWRYFAWIGRRKLVVEWRRGAQLSAACEHALHCADGSEQHLGSLKFSHHCRGQSRACHHLHIPCCFSMRE
jgi:hypothetical protein